MAELKNLRFEINNRDEEKKSLKSSWRTDVEGEEDRRQREEKVAKPGGVKRGGMKEDREQRWSWGPELLHSSLIGTTDTVRLFDRLLEKFAQDPVGSCQTAAMLPSGAARES